MVIANKWEIIYFGFWDIISLPTITSRPLSSLYLLNTIVRRISANSFTLISSHVIALTFIALWVIFVRMERQAPFLHKISSHPLTPTPPPPSPLKKKQYSQIVHKFTPRRSRSRRPMSHCRTCRASGAVSLATSRGGCTRSCASGYCSSDCGKERVDLFDNVNWLGFIYSTLIWKYLHF